MEFTPSGGGIAETGRTPEAAAAALVVADAVAEAAREIAPYDPADHEGPHYRDSFVPGVEVIDGVAAGVVVSTDPAGPYIELGTSDTPAHHTLHNALRAAG